MNNFSGFINFSNSIIKEKNLILENMTLNEPKNNTNELFLILKQCFALSYSSNQLQNQVFTIHSDSNEYTLILNGNLYNSKELKNELLDLGIKLNENTDAEIFLNGYLIWKEKIFTKANGTFSIIIWDDKKKELLLLKDRFGTKPLYYSQINNNFVFSSSIKSLLSHPDIKPVLKESGLKELIGLGPAHTQGTCLFDNIIELKSAHYLVYNKDGIFEEKYWSLQSQEHTDNFNVTCNTIKDLLVDSINRQIPQNSSVCTMLSGGLDSSIITNFVNKKIKNLDTYSVDYIDNDINFKQSEFQPNSDKYYIDIITNFLDINHSTFFIDTPELANSLEEAMITRDLPGMADVDSSLLLFCKEISKHSQIAISGECADEIFGGYPWMFKENTANTFPWSLSTKERQNLLHPSLSKKINLNEYIDYRYFETLKEVNFSDTDSPQNKEIKKLFHLNLNWFMPTLLDRAERIANYTNMEIRVPFCDYRLVEYLWNIPWEIKAYKNREKGLLRYIMENELPNEIIYRKKSPYPKTHNPNYLSKIKEILLPILNNPNSPINNILNIKYVLNVLKNNCQTFTTPWYGQLMTGPQFLAYIYQINCWLEKYKIDIKI